VKEQERRRRCVAGVFSLRGEVTQRGALWFPGISNYRFLLIRHKTNSFFFPTHSAKNAE
jgi:hypothetical protein